MAKHQRHSNEETGSNNTATDGLSRKVLHTLQHIDQVPHGHNRVYADPYPDHRHHNGMTSRHPHNLNG
jgi:hypothetical protein